MSVQTMLEKIEASIKSLEAKAAEKIEERDRNSEKLRYAESEVKKHTQQISDIDNELMEVELQIESQKEKIALVRAYELEQKDAFRASQAAFNTLYSKSEAGTVTSSDIEEFRKVAGYDIPIEEGGEDAEIETEELEQTGT